jgi:hypothetical protein
MPRSKWPGLVKHGELERNHLIRWSYDVLELPLYSVIFCEGNKLFSVKKEKFFFQLIKKSIQQVYMRTS